MKDSLLWLAKKTGYVVAAIIIFAAFLVTLGVIITPVLNSHRSDFEKIASTYLQSPVTIKSVHVGWYKYQPEISLHEVTIFQKNTTEPALQVKRVHLFFSVPKSVWHWQPVLDGVMASGAEITIHQTATGEYSVQGFPAIGGLSNQPYQGETRFADMMGWLSTQSRLILRDIDLHYTGFHQQQRFVTLQSLSLANSGSNHVILGKAILHQDLPTELNLAVEWTGDVTSIPSIKAKIYLYVSGLSLPQWAKDYTFDGWSIRNGVGSAKIWMTWHDGMIRKVQSSFQVYGVDLYSAVDKSIHKINRLSGNVGWKRNAEGQVIAGEDIFIDLPGHLWPATGFYIALAPDASGTLMPRALNLGYLDLSDVQSFLYASSPILPESISKTLRALQLDGDIENLAITFAGPWNDINHISLAASFAHLSAASWQSIPGFENLSGQLKWSGLKGDLVLQTSNALLHYDALFASPLPLEQLSGNVQISQNENKAWIINLPGLHLLNNDLAINLTGSLTLPTTGSPVANLAASMVMPKANHVSHYLPAKIMDKDLVNWLNAAFLSGDIQSAKAELIGPLADFPFDKGNGKFSVAGIVNNIDFRFAPDWPIMAKTHAKILYTGRKMTIDVDRAFMMDMPVNDVHGVIPYFGDAAPQILTVQSGAMKADFAQAMHYVHGSPLEQVIGKMFADVEMHGPLTLMLGLTIPLSKPDQTQVSGDINFTNTTMNLVPWGLQINDLHGALHFTEKDTSAQKIEGILFGQPLTFSLKTIDKSKDASIVRASLATHLTVNDLVQWLKLPASDAVKGGADVSGDLDLSTKAPLELHLKSNLVGIELKLPDQFSKKAETATVFNADIIAQEKQPLKLKLEYAQQLAAALMLDRKGEKLGLTAANLHIGKGDAAWPSASGLFITGDIPELDWAKIKDQMSGASSSTFSDLPLQKIDIKVGKFNILGQLLTQARLQVTPNKNIWSVDIASEQAVGKLSAPMNITRQSTVTAQFEKLELKAAAPQQEKLVIDPKTLPTIAFTAENFEYDGMRLGRVNLQAVPMKSGLSLAKLAVTSWRMDLNATGTWEQVGSKQLSRLQGAASSEHVSDLLSSLGINAHNFVSNKGSFKFDLSWRDAPYSPQLSSMNGSASLDLDRGRIVDVGEASGAKMDFGRMLSVFSLQTIPRRLMFDFSDVFSKGYSFDSFRGDFRLEDGDAYTNNMQIEGPVAGIHIVGSIGLADKDYDLTLSITPHVTSSIPVAAGLLTMNPLVGLGAFAVNTMIGSGVSKVTTYYYNVTGPWNNPRWKTVSPAS